MPKNEVNTTGKRQILPGVPLTDEDRAYLLVRGEDQKVANHDLLWPAEDDEPDDGGDAEEVPMPDFAAMTVSDLQAYAARPDVNVDTSGKKQELVDRLTAWWNAPEQD